MGEKRERMGGGCLGLCMGNSFPFSVVRVVGREELVVVVYVRVWC